MANLPEFVSGRIKLAGLDKDLTMIGTATMKDMDAIVAVGGGTVSYGADGDSLYGVLGGNARPDGAVRVVRQITIKWVKTNALIAIGATNLVVDGAGKAKAAAGSDYFVHQNATDGGSFYALIERL